MAHRGVKRPRLGNDSEGYFGPVQRRIESEEQRTVRLQRQRESYRRQRNSETQEQRDIRIINERERQRRVRNAETQEQQDIR